MAVRTISAVPDTDTSEKLRDELNHILASKTFRHVQRLQQFLKFVVEETMAGRGDELKEYLIGLNVFGKGDSFDPRTDPIVRVQARRLRARLTYYYREEGQNDPVVIELPKGNYAPVFHRPEYGPGKRSIAAALVSRNTVVVLPFTDHTPLADQDHFCTGVREEIIDTLTKASAIRVVAWDRSVDPRKAAEQVHAAMIVSGSVRKSQNTFRITTQLIDTVSGNYLWSKSIDRDLKDTFSVEEEIARSILKKLQAELVGTGTVKPTKRSSENLAAFNLYLQGRHQLGQRTEQGLRKAIDFFEKAIQEDPQSALGYSGLADTYGLLAHYGVLAPSEVWTKTASSAAWAVLLDDESAEAHTSLAHVKSTQDWDWHAAEHEFRRAIELNPRYAVAHHWYAMSCLVPLGRLDEAIEELMVAHALDPVSSIIDRDIARVLYHKRDFEGALEQCDHTIEQNQYFTPAYLTLGLIQQRRGDYDESAAALLRALQFSPESPAVRSALAQTYAAAGRTRETRKIVNELTELGKTRYVSPFEMASIQFALGQVEQGFRLLTKAYEDRSFEVISIKTDPKFDSFRSDPRFVKLFDQLGLP